MDTTRTAIYPGTFDPVTYGHLDILKRCLDIFDKIIIAIAANPSKTPLFTLEERKAMIEEALEEMNVNGRVAVDVIDGLSVEGAKRHGAVALVRGLRAVSDFDFEFQMALMNRHLAPDLHTVYMMPKDEYTYLSSSIIKSVAQHGGDIDRFVPPGVKQRLLAKFNINS